MGRPFFDSHIQVQETERFQKGRRVWVTLRDLTLVCWLDDEKRHITVAAGFETDFASIPRMFWRVFPPSGRYMRASVVHDYLYKNRIGEVPGDPDTRTIARRQADRIFLEGMKALGVSGFKRGLIFRAVRTFGASGWGS